MDGDMRHGRMIAWVLVGLAAMGAAKADPARLPATLTSFGAVQSLSGKGLSPIGPAATFAPSDFTRTALSWRGGVARQSFAASLALSPTFALDSAYNADIADRFLNFDALRSPLLPPANALALANGGTYAGFTWEAAPALHIRAGVAEKNNRLDHFTFDPLSADLGLPLAYDDGSARTLMAGADWDVTDWGSVGVTAVQNSQKGAPYDVDPLDRLSPSARADTRALDVAARVKLGNGWVTTASYASGLTQLDQRAQPADGQSYSIAIAKHGLFGDDALGFSLSRNGQGVVGNSLDLSSISGLPPAFAAMGKLPDQGSETDLQLGYVNWFLDGSLSLQANAAYQLNYQGQTGTNSVSVLSRAKIKF
jgi:hypothetical protein